MSRHIAGLRRRGRSVHKKTQIEVHLARPVGGMGRPR